MPTVVALLKTPDHGAYAEGHGGRLPYGIDLLEDHGFVLRSTDAHLCGFWVRRRSRLVTLRRYAAQKGNFRAFDHANARLTGMRQPPKLGEDRFESAIRSKADHYECPAQPLR